MRIRMFLKDNQNKRIFLLLFLLSILILRLEFKCIDTRREEFRPENGILNTKVIKPFQGESLAPTQYRVLISYIYMPIEYVFEAIGGSRSLRLKYFLLYEPIQLVFLFLSLSSFYYYLCHWFPSKESLIGTLIFVAIIPSVFFWNSAPTVYSETLFFILSFICFNSGNDKLLYPILLVGTLNRESMLFVPCIYFLVNYSKENLRPVLRKTASYFIVVCSVMLLLRIFYGFKPYYCDFLIYPKNIFLIKEMLSKGNYFNPTLGIVYLYLALLPFVFQDFKKKPKFARRASYFIPPFLILTFFIATIREARIYLWTVVILIPLVLFSLFPENLSAFRDRGD